MKFFMTLADSLFPVCLIKAEETIIRRIFGIISKEVFIPSIAPFLKDFTRSFFEKIQPPFGGCKDQNRKKKKYRSRALPIPMAMPAVTWKTV